MNYYVNNKTDNDGHHEVHKQTCHKLPSDRTPLGDYSSCHPAVAKAKTIYQTADGCGICSEECHKG